MRKLALLAGFLLSTLVAAPMATTTPAPLPASEVSMHTAKSNYQVTASQYEIGPRKKYKPNYRSDMARSYFGNGSKCRNWNKFCGR